VNRDATVRTEKSPNAPGVVAEDGVALVDLSLQTVAMDRGAASIVAAASDDGRPRPKRVGGLTQLPPPILALIGRVHPGNGRPVEMCFVAGDASYVVRASLVTPRGAAAQEPRVLVQFQREPKTLDALGELSIKCGLTDREREALSGIAIGLTSKEVALRMKIAPSTVKAFLRLIMIKTGAPNRAGIVAKLVAPADRDDEADDVSWPAAG
jgi:DNA-binding CsgD family transcriptional regulator